MLRTSSLSALYTGQHFEHVILPFPERAQLRHGKCKGVDTVRKRNRPVLRRGRPPPRVPRPAAVAGTVSTRVAGRTMAVRSATVALVVLVVRPADSAPEDLAHPVHAWLRHKLVLAERAHARHRVVLDDLARGLPDVAQLLHERPQLARALGEAQRLAQHAADRGLGLRRRVARHDGRRRDVEDRECDRGEVRPHWVALQHPPQRGRPAEHVRKRSVQRLPYELYRW